MPDIPSPEPQHERLVVGHGAIGIVCSRDPAHVLRLELEGMATVMPDTCPTCDGPLSWVFNYATGPVMFSFVRRVPDA